MNIIRFMWKNFCDEEGPFGEKPYRMILGMIVTLGFSILCIYAAIDDLNTLNSLFFKKETTITVYYNVTVGILMFFGFSLVMIIFFIAAFLGTFFGYKWSYLLLSKPIAYIPAKIACHFTKIDVGILFPSWEIKKNQELKVKIFNGLWWPKPRDKIEKCRFLMSKIILFSLFTYLIFLLALLNISDVHQFNITKNFVTDYSAYKFCYGFDDNPILYPEEKNKHHYMITFALKEVDCPVPEEKYRPYVFTEISS